MSLAAEDTPYRRRRPPPPGETGARARPAEASYRKRPVATSARGASYAAGFALSFATRLIRNLAAPRAVAPPPSSKPARPARPAMRAAAHPARRRAGAPPPRLRAKGKARPAPTRPARPASAFGAILDWLRRKREAWSERLRGLIATFSNRGDGVFEYALVTLAYWGLTITDGAIRMLILFQVYLMGYSAMQIASLFLFYEVFGVLTNLFGGWIGANFGLRVTLFGGLGIQVAALGMLALLNPAWPTWLVIGYVMLSQALSGIAKDLTKMSSKSAIKAVVPKDADATMYRWVSLLTGSKNALKGVGFFVGALLLTVAGFNLSLLIMAAGLLFTLTALWRHLPDDLGRTKQKAKFTSMFSMDRRINILSAARFFLFGARDVWFVVALPVYMAAVFGWSPMVVGGYLALWTIGYGIVQSLAPKFIAAKPGETPKGYTVFLWSAILTAVPVAIAIALGAGVFPGFSLVAGLAAFGVVFAINSAVHSYMIVNYAESEKVAMTIGFYYMANAGGRLAGTVLSGLVYQYAGGIVACLWLSAVFVGSAALISTGLTLPEERRALGPPGGGQTAFSPAPA
jgi:Major Facilitator Superfamily